MQGATVAGDDAVCTSARLEHEQVRARRGAMPVRAALTDEPCAEGWWPAPQAHALVMGAPVLEARGRLLSIEVPPQVASSSGVWGPKLNLNPLREGAVDPKSRRCP